jgi:hypothetical protein
MAAFLGLRGEIAVAMPLGGIGTGYLSPAQPRPSVSLWPTLVPRDQVQMKVTMVETK